MADYLTELKKKLEKINPFKKKIIEGARNRREKGRKSVSNKEKCEMNDEAKYDTKNKKCECPTGTFYNTSDQCQKDIGTLNVFVNTPIANCIVVAVMSLFFAGFLFRIKSSPLAIVKGNCREIPFSTVFKTDPTQGMVYPKIFEDGNKDKYSKMLFPGLNKSLFPTEAEKDTDGGYSVGYIFKMPLYITLQYCSVMWYKTVSIIKQALYKQYQWGYKDEIKKISRGWWIKDFMVIFFVVPFLLFIIYPLFFVASIILSMFVAPIQAIVTFLLKEGVVLKPEWGDEGSIWETLAKGAHILKYVVWVFWYFIGGIFFSLVTFLLTLGYFGSIITGLHEGKRDGPQVVFQTWANIVWDYRYIWAMLAGGMWILRFKNYLKSSTSNWYPMTVMKGEYRDTALGIITALLFILLGQKQAAYVGSLAKTIKPRCTSNCNAPKPPITAIPTKSKKKKDCVD